MDKRSKRRVAQLIMIFVVLGMAAIANNRIPAYERVIPPAGTYSVVAVDDGDTIVVNMDGKKETVRFIGVDTPETHDPRKPVQCYGHVATTFTKELIGNQPVKLEADPANTNRDRYNRLLRYVYLPDSRLVNAELIKQGYGFAYTAFPFKKLEEFKTYQKYARNNNLGLWDKCEPAKNQFGGFSSNPTR